jgi:hypothetical protein
MNRKTFFLDYDKAKKLGVIVDMQKYYEKYDVDTRSQYKLLTGAPIVINVEGTYVYLDMIPLLVQNLPTFVSNNIRDIKYAINNDDADVVEYRWKRNDD